jgi:hypothetical protein
MNALDVKKAGNLGGVAGLLSGFVASPWNV